MALRLRGPSITALVSITLAACEPDFQDEYCLSVEKPSPACRAKLGIADGGAGGQAGSPSAGAAGAAGKGPSAGGAGSGGVATGGKAGASGSAGTTAGASGSAGATGGASGQGGTAGAGGASGGGSAGNAGTAGAAGIGGTGGAPGCTLPKAECEAVTQVVLGRSHACYLRFEGTVFCWGKNELGQLGSGFAPGLAKTAPTRVDGLDDITRLAAGEDTTCAIRKTGEVVCWGSDDKGKLGRDQAVTGDVRGMPAPVAGVSGARDLAVGPVHACAADGAGKLVCWGDNTEGQLDKEVNLVSRKAVPIALPAPATVGPGGLTATATRTCAVQTGGTVSCLGIDCFAAGGAVQSSGLAAVQNASAMSAVRGGLYFACGLQPAAGTVACWGRADEGQLGISPAADTNSNASARAVPSLEGVGSLAAGDAHTCAALTTGEVLCWGDCSQGQCGNGATVGSVPKLASPTLVPALTAVEAIYAGAQGTCARLGSGGLACWGNVAGASPTATPSVVPLP